MSKIGKQAGPRGLAPLLAALSAVALLLAVALAPRVARAEDAADDDEVQTLYYRPTANPVADRTVHVDVHKLGRETREYVKGAQLQIIDKATGEVMAEWTTGEEKQQINRILDVSDERETHVYVLREVSAPEGFERADDVEFIVKSVNFETKGEVLSGAETADGKLNAEFRNVEGDIETQAFVINLYDAETPSYLETVERRTTSSEQGQTSTTERPQAEQQRTEGKSNERLSQTGDGTPFAAMVGLACAGGVFLVAGIYFLRRRRTGREA